MPLKVIDLNGRWQLKETKHSKNSPDSVDMRNLNKSEWLSTPVPGDIHPTLLKAKKIPDPFLDKNSDKCTWTAHKDWWFKREFNVPKSLKGKTNELVFDSIDTYSAIYLNGKKIGETDNMFLQYRFDVTKQIKYGKKNSLVVCIKGTKSVIESRDTSMYMACFYTPRIFARKPQCQFSWDWAPHLPSLGISQSVRLESTTPGIINDIFIRTRINGKVHIIVEVDRQTKRLMDQGQKFQLQVEIKNGTKKTYKKKINISGIKNIVNIKIENPKLWWPNGYGKPELYKYKVSLLNGKKQLHQKTGAFGIREIQLIQEPNGGDTQSFFFKVNGQRIFCMGANWVPLDCFPSTIRDSRYEHILELTKQANFNMLRVWGGGMYESDKFYDLCDQKGIMIWQDMMFACADIPDNDSEFTMSLIPEFNYQVKRLRNHPCLAHWCGGNEKTGAFGELISAGDIITHYLARGVVNELMPDLTYTSSSPISLTECGNDPNSGDTHGGTYEEAYEDNINKFRSYIDKKQAVFMSEFGLHGPPQLRSLKKFMSKEKLWPINDIWEHHVQDNPYNSLPETFVQVQERSASKLFHKPNSPAEFVKVAGTFHAEYLYAEFQHHRRRQPINSGALIWMLNDCWPCASWSIIDYYGLPKQVYYALKRAAQPVSLSFRALSNKQELYVAHNLKKPINANIKVYLQNVDGTVNKKLKTKKVSIPSHTSKNILTVLNKNIPKIPNSYLVAKLTYNNKIITETYFHKLWSNIDWPQPGLSVKASSVIKKNGQYHSTVTIKTKKYARCVNLAITQKSNAYFSDNFFDITPGKTKKIDICSAKPFNPEKIKINHWLTTWN